MAVPKRKTSNQRRDLRRTHWKLSVPTMGKCSHCGSVKEPHRVCNVCGYYAGVEIFRPEEV